MDIKKDLTIHFSETEVKKIIANHLRQSGYDVTHNDVRLAVGTKIEGYGLGECETVYFKGAYIYMSRKKDDINE